MAWNNIDTVESNISFALTSWLSGSSSFVLPPAWIDSVAKLPRLPHESRRFSYGRVDGVAVK